ncbi:MAG: hypothetical protein JOZ72_14170 [Alphaproteobacteria bacterium]|nr:hypothetical protein [Alphaproteobacteria bacterium]
MADTTTTAANDTDKRDAIALKIITWSAAGIVVISMLVILVAIVPIALTDIAHRGTMAEDMSKQTGTVFNALLPLFGTWVGTVLAYYFSNQNFKDAAATTQSLLGQMDEKLRKVRIETVWIPMSAIKGIELSADKTEDKIALPDVLNMLSKVVTRIPVFSERHGIVYLIHESLLYRYYARSPDADKDKKTLKDFLDFDDTRGLAKVFAVMGSSGTLADAKTAMDGTDGAQDVFATTTGKADDPVIGWITNSVIVDNAKT